MLQLLQLPRREQKQERTRNWMVIKIIYSLFDNKVSTVSVTVRQVAVKPGSCRSGGYSCLAPGTPGQSSSQFFS